MSVRFDEVELLKEPELPSPESVAASLTILSASAILPGVQPPERTARRPAVRPTERMRAASRFHRALAFLTDVSLFFALALALTPLLPYRTEWAEQWPTVLALGGFLLLLSYYYFVMGWLIWGKTVGGAIFDVRIVTSDGAPMTARGLTYRWLTMLLSIAVGGLGFLPALLPGGRSLADRLSHTRSVAA